MITHSSNNSKMFRSTANKELFLHTDKWQKPTQHCKVIILQLKTNNLKKVSLDGFNYKLKC